MDLVTYETVPEGYGQIRFCPLFLANKTNTLLEEWFANYKFLHFCMNRDVESEFAQYHLAVEFSYSLRERDRSYEQLKHDVSVLVDRSLFQDLFRILVTALEMANELYEIAVAKKEGRSVWDLRTSIEEKKRKFHRLAFPEKIKKFEVAEKFQKFLEVLNAVNKARNCYEHRNGILGKEDCNDGDRLVLNYYYPAPVSEDGKAVGVFDSMPMEKRFKTQFVKNRRIFRAKAKLNLGFDDSYKLLYTINFSLKGIVDDLYKKCDATEQGPILKQFKT